MSLDIPEGPIQEGQATKSSSCPHLFSAWLGILQNTELWVSQSVPLIGESSHMEGTTWYNVFETRNHNIYNILSSTVEYVMPLYSRAQYYKNVQRHINTFIQLKRFAQQQHKVKAGAPGLLHASPIRIIRATTSAR